MARRSTVARVSQVRDRATPRHSLLAEEGLANYAQENKQLRAALCELVRLKDLHDACEDQTYWATRAVSDTSLAQLRAWGSRLCREQTREPGLPLAKRGAKAPVNHSRISINSLTRA